MNSIDIPEVKLFRYFGKSMWPCFQEGDLLLIRIVPFEKLRAGDCIVYRNPCRGHFIVHRIIAVKPVVITRGDTMKFADNEPVLPAWLEGLVMARMRYGHIRLVRNGSVGICAGIFYRCVGLLDPMRGGKTGKLARTILTLLGPIGRILENHHIPATILTTGKGPTSSVW